MFDRRITTGNSVRFEVLAGGVWKRPVKVNDHRDKGWIGYQLMDKYMGVAMEGQWRYICVGN